MQIMGLFSIAYPNIINFKNITIYKMNHGSGDHL